jgi:hypothetical protein
MTSLQTRFHVRTLLCYAITVGVLTQAARPAQAVGEQVGRIRGVITNPTGQPLDAVTVEATGPALIGGPRSVFSNSAGRYEIAGLPPGSYTLQFSYPGTKALTREVAVRLGEAVTLNVSWSVESSETDVVSVREARQLTRPDSTATGTVRDYDSTNRMPTSRSYQGIALQVPGTSGGANPNIKGGSDRNNKYLIDGMDVTDPVTNTFTKNITYESMGSVDVLTGGMDAEYNAIGGVINVVTKGGGEAFHATASVYANHSDLSASGNYGTNLYELKQPFNDLESGLTRSGQVAVNVGGPVLANKLWFSATYELFLSETAQVKGPPLGVPPYNIQHPSETSANHLGRLRLHWVPSLNNRVWVNLMADPGSFNNTANGNSRLGVAENHQDQGGGFVMLGWEWLGSQTFQPTVQLGLLSNTLEVGPQGWLGKVDFTGCDKFSMQNCTYDRNRAQRFNSNDLTTWYQGDAYQLDKRYKIQLDPSLIIRGQLVGSHTAKVGIQAQYVYRTRKAEVPGGFSYEDLNEDGLLLEEGLCDPMTGAGCFRQIETEPLDAKETGYAIGLFVQDRWWTPLQWLTINPGLRGDIGYTQDRLGRRIYRQFALAPRLGATADVTQDGRNILFAYYGRHTEPLSLATASSVDAIEGSRDITREWDPATMSYNPMPVVISGGPGGIIVDTKTKMPRSDEITGGARREIFTNAVASIEYTWKRIEYTWDTLEINRVWDPSGSRVIGWHDPTKPGQDVQKYTTPRNTRIYQGLVFATEGRPTPNWDYFASYTLSWDYGSFKTDNPRQERFADGFLSRDLRNYLRFGGSYIAFKQLVLGAYMQYQTGATLTKGFYNAFDNSFGNQRSPSGTTTTTPNDIKGISQFRAPDFFRTDLRLSYNVLPNRFRNQLNLIVDLFNVMNLRNPTGVTTSDVARFGQVSGRQSPFRAQLAINWSY